MPSSLNARGIELNRVIIALFGLVGMCAELGCGSSLLTPGWPPELDTFQSAIVVVLGDGWAEAESHVLPPSSPIRIPVEHPDAEEARISLLLYDETLPELGIVPGAKKVARGQVPCELSEPDRVFESRGFDWQAGAVDPRAQAFLTGTVPCERLSCAFRIEAQVSIAFPGELTRVLPLDDHRVLIVSNGRGLEIFDLRTGQLEPLPHQPPGSTLDAVADAEDLVAVVADGSLHRGGVGRSFTLTSSASLEGGSVYGAVLQVDPVSREIFAFMGRVPEAAPPYEVSLVRIGSERDVLDAFLAPRLATGRMDLVYRSPGSFVGAFGGTRLVEIEDREVAEPQLPVPPIEPRGDAALLYAVDYSAAGTYFTSTQSGSIHRFDGVGQWTTIRGSSGTTANVPVSALLALGEGVFFVDELGTTGFLDRKFGACFIGDVPGLDATSIVRVGDEHLVVVGTGATPEAGGLAVIRLPELRDF